MIQSLLIGFAVAGVLVPVPPVAPILACAIPTQEVLDCGFPGITQAACIAKGCCFNGAVSFTCYFKPVPKIPVNGIINAKGVPVNLDANGVPQDVPDMIDESQFFPQILYDPKVEGPNTPERPTRNGVRGLKPLALIIALSLIL